MFFTHPREAVSYHYERNPADPRIQHALTLEVDAYGNVLKAAAIGYGRRQPDASLPTQTDRDKQTLTLITYTENLFASPIESDDIHRNPLPCEAITFELTGYTPTGPVGRFQSADLVEPDPHVVGRLRLKFKDEVAYEAAATANTCRRPIEHVRTLYRPNDCGNAANNPLTLLVLGTMESLGLPGESYKLAFTPTLADQIYIDGNKNPLKPTTAELAGMLSDEGGYAHTEGDTNWWIPSGRIYYHIDPNAKAVTEMAEARAHFFLPRRFRNPFDYDVVVDYDNHDLLMLETRDGLGNCVTVGERDTADNLTRQGNDYRVLQPALMMDPNRNRSAAAFDALGMVAGTAVMGKPEDNPAQGDLLDNSFATDLTTVEIDLFYNAPLNGVVGLLAKATTRIVYDVDRYRRSRAANPKDSSKWEAVFAATLARDTHFADPLPQGLKIQVGFSYSDGFGREIQKKIQAEPGPVPTRDTHGKIVVETDGQPVMSAKAAASRWVGSGWTIFNNKGKPVRQFEPFFSDTHKPDFDVRIGVSPVLFYDPVGRAVATLHPNCTYEKVVFDPWRQTSFDVNDNVASDPRTDPDIKGYVEDYFATQPTIWKTWLQRRVANPQNPPADTMGQIPELDAAVRALAHANTPSNAHFDALGRTFLTVVDNGPDPANPGQHLLFATRVMLDIEGNQREVRDERKLPNGNLQQRAVLRYDYDMLGNRVHQASMEAGERWVLNDVAGKTIRAWDSRGHAFKTEYDQLRRPLRFYVRGSDPVNSDPRTFNRDMLFEKIEYGEGQTNNTKFNLRTRVFKAYDGAGVVTNNAFDFKGNLLSGRRQIAEDYKALLDWSGAVNRADTFDSSTTYDALNRPITLTTPDASVVRPAYNEANLLKRVDVNLRGASVATAFVINIDYNAKGQRERIDYGTKDGSGISTTYDYDPLTFRLISLKTRRNAAEFDPTDRTGEVQNLFYTYDPTGNITHIRDDAQDTIYFKNLKVEPTNDYIYDAIYRLIQATGREHLGQNRAPIPHSYNDAQRTGLVSPAAPSFGPDDRNAMGRYRETYQYDEVGNFTTMRHNRTDGGGSGWTRNYDYNEGSQLELGIESNRLTSTHFNDGTYEIYSAMGDGYDPHGNMRRMPQLHVMQWDFKDRLLMTQRQRVNTDDGDGNTHTGEKTYYVYDGSGQRVRKVTERQAAAGVTPTRMKESIYAANFEIYREYANDGTTVSLERQTLHVMDDKKRIALVETKTGKPTSVIRFQFGNHLGSVSLELDDQAQIISYEEYTPYGSTAYQAVRSQTETAKRYRYTGKERDDESGLYYHGARYCAPWLGRWTSCDPLSIQDGPNLYVYAQDRPSMRVDPSGTQTQHGDLLHQPCSNSPTGMCLPSPMHIYTTLVGESYPPVLVGRIAEDISTLVNGPEDPATVHIKETVDQWAEAAPLIAPFASAGVGRGPPLGGAGPAAPAATPAVPEALPAAPATTPAVPEAPLAAPAATPAVPEAPPAEPAPAAPAEPAAPPAEPATTPQVGPGNFGPEDVAFGLARPEGESGVLLKFAGKAEPGTRAPLSEAASFTAPGPAKNLAIANDTLAFAREVIRRTGGSIRFNLKGFDVQEAITPGSKTYNSVTSAEFRGILNDVELAPRTSFYDPKGADVTKQILQLAKPQ